MTIINTCFATMDTDAPKAFENSSDTMSTKQQYAPDSFSWTLVDIVLMVFASCTFAYEIVLVSRLPTWSWYPFSILILGISFALKFRLGDHFWKIRKLDPPTLLLIVFGLACSSINSFTFRPDADDFSFFHRALFGLSDLSQSIPIQHTAHDVESLPPLSPVHLTSSIEVVTALVAKAVSVQPLIFYQQITGAISLFIFPFVYFLLFRYLQFSQNESFFGISIILLLFVFSGDSHQDWGNFTLVRAWQGKCILIALLVPLTSLLTFKFLQTGFSSDLLRIHLAAICGIGLSGSSFFLFPFIIGFSILGAAPYQYKEFNFLKKSALLCSTFLWFFILIITIKVGALPDVSNTSVWQLSSGTSERPDIYMLSATLFQKKTTIVFFLISLLGTLWFNRHNRRIAALITASLFISAALVTPPVSSILIKLTLPGAYWRLAYASQMLLVIGIFVVICFFETRRNRYFTKKIKLVFGIFFISTFALLKTPAINSSVLSTPHILKFAESEISFVNFINGKIPHSTHAITPEELVPALGLLRPDIRLISTRRLETMHVFVNAGREREGQLRIDAQQDLDSCGGGGHLERIMREQKKLAAIVFPESCATEKIISNLSVNRNEWTITHSAKYQLWQRISIN